MLNEDLLTNDNEFIVISISTFYKLRAGHMFK